MITETQKKNKEHRRILKQLRTARNSVDREKAQALKFKARRYTKQRHACEKKIRELQLRVDVLEVKEMRLRPDPKEA